MCSKKHFLVLYQTRREEPTVRGAGVWIPILPTEFGIDAEFPDVEVEVELDGKIRR